MSDIPERKTHTFTMDDLPNLIKHSSCDGTDSVAELLLGKRIVEIGFYSEPDPEDPRVNKDDLDGEGLRIWIDHQPCIAAIVAKDENDKYTTVTFIDGTVAATIE